MSNAADSGLIYSAAANDAGVAVSLSIYADRQHLREQLREDAEAAGFRISEAAGVAELLEGSARPLGEVVLLDCPLLDGGILAALARLDMRAAHSSAQLVVSTTLEALDDVFACMDQSSPQILVDPSRAERVIALGRVIGRTVRLGVREVAEADRLMLLRLTEQVGQIAQRLEQLSQGAADGLRLSSPAPAYSGPDGGDGAGDRLRRQARPPLPEARLVRRILRQRQLRSRYFAGNLFADPAWDMLLDLTAARVEHARVSVSSLCIASGVPPTTALRWIAQMTEAGLFCREEDDTDRRRAFIALSDTAADAMARYFAELGRGAGRLI